MTTTQDRVALRCLDIQRWPDIAPVRPAGLRGTVARLLLKRVVQQTGVRIAFPDGTAYGKDGAPTITVLHPEQFLSRLGRDGLIGFGEGYMAVSYTHLTLPTICSV